MRPFQTPHMPIAIAGLTPNSENHRLAGAKGYIPVSLSVSPGSAVTAQHWRAVSEGAASVGRTASRSDWRIIRDVYVAPTDAEARSLALNGIMGRCWREFLLPLYLGLGLGPLLKGDPAMADDDITVEYLADHLWLVGSPGTVARRVNELHDRVGGFGRLLVVSYDASAERQAWERSLHLLMERVAPSCASGALAAAS